MDPGVVFLTYSILSEIKYGKSNTVHGGEDIEKPRLNKSFSK